MIPLYPKFEPNRGSGWLPAFNLPKLNGIWFLSSHPTFAPSAFSSHALSQQILGGLVPPIYTTPPNAPLESLWCPYSCLPLLPNIGPNCSNPLVATLICQGNCRSRPQPFEEVIGTFKSTYLNCFTLTLEPCPGCPSFLRYGLPKFQLFNPLFGNFPAWN